jgi:hypothetical protein
MKSIPFEATGNSGCSIRCRIQVPTAENSRLPFDVPMQEAMYKVWSGYSEVELQLLLRFANEGYRAVLEATEKLKGAIDAPKETAARKRGRPPRR